MKKIVFLLILNILFTGSSIANSSMETSLFEAKTKELINGKSKKWIIIDGIGIGLIINSSKNSENIIDPKLNEITHANGEISLPDLKCKGNLNYFKGNILELYGDEKNICGEGRVIKYENASPLLQKLSSLLLLQEKIRSNIHHPKTDLNLIKKDIFKSVKELSTLVKEVKANKHKNITHSKEGIILNLNNAISSNLSSIKKLNSTEGEAPLKDIFKKLSEAYDSEINVIERVVKSEEY